MEDCTIEKLQGDLNESNDDARPTSLRLESVLEYTNRIKTFLGLQDEPNDSATKEPQAKNSGNGFKMDVGTRTNEERSFDKNIDGEISTSKSENTASSHNGLESSALTLQPLPDIVGIQPDALEDVDLFPDILERSKNNKIEELIDPTFENIIREKSNDFPICSDNDSQDLIPKVNVSAEVIVCGEKYFAKTEGDTAVTKTVKDIKDEISQDGLSDTESKTEYDDAALVQKFAQENFRDKSRKVQNGEDSDEENPYQITHIEEGLRQVEKCSKATLPPEANEPQTIFKENVDVLTLTESPKTKSMEDIRRLSTEVVHTVLQIAGDEVKDILQNRENISEENTPLSTEESLLDDPPERITLRDTEVEFKSNTLEILADIPEEESLQTITSRKISSTTSLKTTIPVGSKHSIDRIEVTDEIDFDVQCGFGPFKPRWLQSYATANVYVILYSIIGILHGSYYTYLVGVLTTLEKRFEFKSKTSGFIMMLDELTPLFLGVLVGHFGGRAHRPRLLSFGMFLSAFCCFASALPYFLYGTTSHLSSSVHNVTSVEKCDVRIEHCDDDDRPPTLTAILLLMLGSFLKGFGNLAYYAIGLAYLDDNAKKRNTPLYFAVAFALRLLGPMVGFLMSSAFLKYYENPLVTPDFGPDDPRWIGGWWMGFVLQGILLLIFAGPMALFPRRLPDHRPLMHEMELNSKSMFDGLGDSLKRLARNPLYMLIGLNAIFTVYGNFGYYIMLPKYMENQFRLSASSASLFAGPPGIAALMVSCIIGGYLIWKFKPTAKFLAGGLVTLELISTLGYLILMIPQCDKIEMTHFGLSEGSFILESECNLNCNCSTVAFTPVCGPDGASYFSPCYAGCSFQKDQSFYNCSCLPENAFVTKGFCSSENCWSQALAYIVTLPVLQFVVNILRVAYTMIMLRSIKPEDKNIALGVFETVLSTVAFIPFPVLYGALVDSACLVWEKSCGETGNCWFYDIQKFNYIMHGGSAFFSSLSTLNLVAIFFLVHRIKDLYKDED